MPIVMYLGRNIKEYGEQSEEIIAEALSEEKLQCPICLRPMARHSRYTRGIRETGQKIAITVVWCSKCRDWHALLPDFLLPQKHYSGNEIESVIIDSGSMGISELETEASESTVRRWIRQVGERIRQASGILKHLFRQAGVPLSEAAIEAGHCYSELEQILGMAPQAVRSSGNKLGLANMWLRTNAPPASL